MNKWQVFPAWARILRGYKPFLSVEVTRECPLRCPGCYAYQEEHLNNGKALRQIEEIRGKNLSEGILNLVRRYRPLHLSIVGGEPLLRLDEMEILLPKLNQLNVEVQIVTSAVRPIPQSWAGLPNINLVVSVDGLPAEHDIRRAPAIYDRILNNVKGHKIIVHCVVLRSMLSRPDYLSEFAEFWSRRPETRKIWFSLYTPQQGEESKERLSKEERLKSIEMIRKAGQDFAVVDAPRILLEGYRQPPSSPQECIFAMATLCLAPDLKTTIAPCQIGGKPDCSECGCIASAGLTAIGQLRLLGSLRVADIFRASWKIGERQNRKTSS